MRLAATATAVGVALLATFVLAVEAPIGPWSNVTGNIDQWTYDQSVGLPDGVVFIDGGNGIYFKPVSDLSASARRVGLRLTAGGSGAEKEFTDDLDAMAESSEIKPNRADIDALGRELAAVLPKTVNADALQARLAQLLFVATRRAPIPAERITQLEGEVMKPLADHGVPGARAKSIGAQLGSIARDARRPR